MKPTAPWAGTTTSTPMVWAIAVMAFVVFLITRPFRSYKLGWYRGCGLPKP